MTITYKIDFFDFWHAGSGLAGSTYADSLVIKNENGLPIIPGKTLKGLIREAAQALHELDPNLVTSNFIDKNFGIQPKKNNDDIIDDRNADANEGLCFFTNATLSKYLSDALVKDAAQRKELYQVLSSTAIDGDGQAKEGSLRQLEVTIPLGLYAQIFDFPDDNASKIQLEYCLKWIKELGLNRNRGLGRCQLSIIS
jgi:CRISPR/Cas system CSM-associated protein Csm3 (group 7 of RAMP superfamily)